MADQLTVDDVLCTTRAVRRRLDLSRSVPRELLLECLAIAQQAPSASNKQPFHFVVVTDPSRRAFLGSLFRRGLCLYKQRQDSLYREEVSDPDEVARRRRLIASLEHLASNIDAVPVHVVPCVEGLTEESDPVRVAALMASVIPAAWSFMLAARARGVGTCWSTLHLPFADEVGDVLEIPTYIRQVALIPTAYSIGSDFCRAHRRPLHDIVHWDMW
jgi:nitroreductase